MNNEIELIRASLPQAQRPDRTRRVDVGGIEVSVVEWGDEKAQPVLLAHGGFDFAGTFDILGPLLAAAGFRAVAWDQRGHGDSDLAALYTWEADVRDAALVLASLGSADPVPVLGHSKGGGMVDQLAEVIPHRIGAVINLMASLTNAASRKRLTELTLPPSTQNWRRGWIIDGALGALTVEPTPFKG